VRRTDVPDRFHATAADRRSLGHTVAEAYQQIAEDLRHGTHRAPTFADGLRRHHTLAAVHRAAETGERQVLPQSRGSLTRDPV
jgi:predicted dehydrogenase